MTNGELKDVILYWEQRGIGKRNNMFRVAWLRIMAGVVIVGTAANIRIRT